MFNFFRRPRFVDPDLGELIRSGSYWRTTFQHNGNTVGLAISGPRFAPEPSALMAAKSLNATLLLLDESIDHALFEHYLPYLEALELSEHEPTFPKLKQANEVRAHANLVFVSSIGNADGAVLELGYTVNWDEEHMIGITIKDGQVSAVSGSIIPV